MTLLLALTPALLVLPEAIRSPPCAAAEVPYVIFEDDFDSDSDGPMALCLLLELEAAGECKIIACGTSELHEDSTGAMAATLHYFGRGNIPLGSYRDDVRPRDPERTQLYDDSYFDANMASDTFNYGHPRRNRRDYPDAVEVYVKALNALPPGAKAKLIVGGAHNNLRDLLARHPDVVRARISELHFMGGWCWPDNGKPAETDWNRDSNLWSTRDEFTATRGKNATETLQTRRGWIKAGHPASETLIDGSESQHYSEKAQFVQFTGNSPTLPYNAQLRYFGTDNLRVRARVMATHQDGFIGLCVRSDPAANPMGINLRVQPGGPGLRLYQNNTALPQTRTLGVPTAFTTRTWYAIDLQAEGDRIIGRLYNDSDNVVLLEQVECTLPDRARSQHAGLIARGNGERADWFQFGARQAGSRLRKPAQDSP